MLSKLTLTKECPFQFNKDLKVGHMRCDFANGKLANSWFPDQNLFSTLTQEDKKEIQEIANDIMFEQLNTFDKIIDACDGNEGYGNERNYFTQSKNFDYWIRLNPIESDYSMYIHSYKKA